MSVPKSKLITVEIGSSWTRVFVIDHDKDNKLRIVSSASLPTTTADLTFVVNALFEKLAISPKENSLVWTSSLDEASSITADFKGVFVPFAEVKKSLVSYLKDQGYPSCTIFDVGAGVILDTYRASDVGKFLTFSIGETELENHLANLTIHPQSIPETKNEIEIAEALVRASFIKKEERLGHASNILLTGSLISAHPSSARLAMIVLDILGEAKVADCVIDKGSFAGCWGAALTKYPDLANYEIDFLEKLGTFVSIGGQGEVNLDYGLKEGQQVSVSEGEIALIPASRDQKVSVSFLVGKEVKKFGASGGSFGILIDGRAKPLPVVFAQNSSQKAMLKWREAIEKVEIIS